MAVVEREAIVDFFSDGDVVFVRCPVAARFAFQTADVVVEEEQFVVSQSSQLKHLVHAVHLQRTDLIAVVYR